ATERPVDGWKRHVHEPEDSHALTGKGAVWRCTANGLFRSSGSARRTMMTPIQNRPEDAITEPDASEVPATKTCRLAGPLWVSAPGPRWRRAARSGPATYRKISSARAAMPTTPRFARVLITRLWPSEKPSAEVKPTPMTGARANSLRPSCHSKPRETA